MRAWKVVALVVAAAVLFSACGDDDTTAKSGTGRLDVVANFYPMAYAAARVGGDRVTVRNLTPAGVEPHDLELTPRQVDEIQDVDVVVYLGKGFQPAVADVASRRDRDKDTLDVLRSIPLSHGSDPHFWLDPTLMAKAVDAIETTLAKTAPDSAATFQANADTLRRQLAVLDADFEQGLAHCERTQVVTSHAAFFYLSRRYHLTQLAVAGLSPEAEPDADRIATLADEIEAKGITTVFYEELVSPKVSQTLAREAGVKTAVLSPIEGLSKAEVAAGKDYDAVMRDNLAALRDALGCR